MPKAGDGDTPKHDYTNPLDPFGFGTAALQAWKGMLADPQSLEQTQKIMANAWAQISARVATPEERGKHIIDPQPDDTRWNHPAWTQNPVLDSIREAYLLATKAAMDSIDKVDGLDADEKLRLKFFTKQFCDAMSPTNSAILNPAVIDETIQSRGENLQRGFLNFLEDLRTNEGRPALVNKSAFEIGRNIATTSGMVIFRNDLIELIQYAPATSTVYERPIVVTPPWINKYYILDLQPKNSPVKFAIDHGFTVFVISWRNPDPSMAGIAMEDYLEQGPLAAARIACEISGSRDVNLLGYCIGGTLVAMLLAYLAKTEQNLVHAVTFLASLVDFDDAGDLRAFLTPQSVAYIEDMMQEQGVLQGAQMADSFNLLRSHDLIWNVAVSRYLLGKEAPAVDLLYWNSDATRIPRATHSYYLRNMYLENNLIKPDVLKVKGVPIDLRRIYNEAYSVAALKDHITPWRAVYRMTQVFSGTVRFVLGHSGHIAGIINPPAAEKGFWQTNTVNPPNPDEWLASAEKHSGSWWNDWAQWLAQQSGEHIPARKELGSEKYPSLVPAPGTYVLE